MGPTEYSVPVPGMTHAWWKMLAPDMPICWPINYLNRAERRKRQFAKGRS